jgi:hypothetical protein
LTFGGTDLGKYGLFDNAREVVKASARVKSEGLALKVEEGVSDGPGSVEKAKSPVGLRALASGGGGGVTGVRDWTGKDWTVNGSVKAVGDVTGPLLKVVDVEVEGAA